METATSQLSADALYEQNMNAYLKFLGWRHLTLAGYLVVVFAICRFFISSGHSNLVLQGALLAFTAFFSLIIFQIEARTHEAVKYAMAAGKSLEHGGGGFFTTQETHLKLSNLAPHGALLNVIYGAVGISAAALALGIVFGLDLSAICTPPKASP